VRRVVEVLVGDNDVTIFDGPVAVARHRRGREPYQRIIDPSHFDGIFRRDHEAAQPPTPLARNLDAYAACIGGAV
jgi:hypothetical protein